MQLIVGNYDISELVENIVWSGDTSQVARTLKVSAVRKEDFKVKEGERIVLKEKNKIVFSGIIFDIDRTASSFVEQYLAYDLMIYINNSDINARFKGTPESITTQVCNLLGIRIGRLAKTGIQVSMPCFGKRAYEAIMAAYTVAARKNGKKYIPRVNEKNELEVIEKGELCGVVLDGEHNLIEATFKTSLQNMVNRVLITDKNNNIVKKIDDSGLIGKYGVIQRVLKQEEKKDMTSEAKNMIKGAEYSGAANGLSNDFKAISGKSIIIREKETGLNGKFYIESDSHTFSAGKAEMSLTLAFENLMDEKEIEKESGNK